MPLPLVIAAACLTAVVGTTSAARAGSAPPAAATNWAPVSSADFPDPAILHDPVSGMYFGFATQNTTAAGPTVNIQESTSTDGVHWVNSAHDALPTLGSWATRGDTWAPSVSSDVNGGTTTYVMYYTATEAAAPGYQCIGIATSTTPAGPYHDASSAPAVCQDGSWVNPTVDNGNYGGSIDPDIFTDPTTGNSWLLWKSDGNRAVGTTVIWSVPLSPSLVPRGATPTQLLQADQPWQANVVEGPDMVYEPATAGAASGSYDLFYSGSLFDTNTYAVGWAVCPGGPGVSCNDSTTTNPLLTTAPGVSGPGGPFVYTDAAGAQVLAFAGWEGTTVGYGNCGVRAMYLATLSLNADGTPASLSPAVFAGSPAVGPSCPQPPGPPAGYWQVASDGGIFSFGGAQFYGSTGSMRLNQPVVGMAATPDGRGYWLVASDGGIFAFGDAGFYGSTGSIRLNKPIVGMMPTLDGGGYWLVASDGGVFAFGDAPFYGSAGGQGLTFPVTGAAASFLGGGYWLVDSDGQIFTYGNARYEGAPQGAPGGYYVTGIAGSHSSNGYWLVSANGNVAGFGDAAPYGSAYGLPLAAPVVGIAPTHDGAGYWLQGRDGGIFTYGDAPFFGSMGRRALNAPMVGIAAT